MWRSLELSILVPLGLLSACLPPPAEVTTSGTSGDPAPTTTISTTSLDPDTTASPEGSAGSSSTSTPASSSSSAGEDESSTGEPQDEPLGPFGPAEPAIELNSPYSEDDPTLTGDLLEIYFASTRSGNEDVWTSTRVSVGAGWDAPEAVDSLNTFYTETFPEVSADGLIILLASNRAGIDFDVYFSRRGARGEPWPTPQPLPGAATALDDYGATPSPDLTSVLLCRVAPEGLGQSDIWQAPVDFGAWQVSKPVLIAELSSTLADCSATLSPSRREIFFESTRQIGAGFEWNLWTATREDPEGAWDEPVAVEELNGDYDDIDPWLSPDRRTLWFASGTAGTYELYVAVRE